MSAYYDTYLSASYWHVVERKLHAATLAYLHATDSESAQVHAPHALLPAARPPSRGGKTYATMGLAGLSRETNEPACGICLLWNQQPPIQHGRQRLHPPERRGRRAGGGCSGGNGAYDQLCRRGWRGRRRPRRRG